jgi:hypothetical protein
MPSMIKPPRAADNGIGDLFRSGGRQVMVGVGHRAVRGHRCDFAFEGLGVEFEGLAVRLLRRIRGAVKR